MKKNYRVLYKKRGFFPPLTSCEIREYPPCSRTVFYNSVPIYTSFPRLLFATRRYGFYSHLIVAAAPEPIASDDDFVHAIPLSNLYGCFYVCLGNSLWLPQKITARLDTLIRAFWSSNFSHAAYLGLTPDGFEVPLSHPKFSYDVWRDWVVGARKNLF